MLDKTDKEIIEEQRAKIEDLERRLRDQFEYSQQLLAENVEQRVSYETAEKVPIEKLLEVEKELEKAEKKVEVNEFRLKKKNEHISELRRDVIRLEQEKKQHFDAVEEVMNLQNHIKELNLLINDLKSDKKDLQEELERAGSAGKRKHNERGAGRKRDKHLEVYLLGCWAKEMTDQEIIGSEYDGYDGKKKVARASYYRAKKRLIGQRDKTSHPFE